MNTPREKAEALLADMRPDRRRKHLLKPGDRFGRLVIRSGAPQRPFGQRYWLCQCDCGQTKEIRDTSLWSGRTKSCGCLMKEVTGSINFKHGHARPGKQTRTYRCWRNMLQRCEDATHPHYKNYGGRGIGVCERWHDFKMFLADMGESPDGMTIERVHNGRNYTPGNCKWANRVEQCNNKRNNRVIIIDGERKTMTQWARFFGVSTNTFYKRTAKGMPPEEAFTKRALVTLTAVQMRDIRRRSMGYGALKRTAREFGVSYSTIRAIYHGYGKYAALA